MAGPEESGIRSETHTYGFGRGWHRNIGTLSRKVVDVWLCKEFRAGKELITFNLIISFATDEIWMKCSLRHSEMLIRLLTSMPCRTHLWPVYTQLKYLLLPGNCTSPSCLLLICFYYYTICRASSWRIYIISNQHLIGSGDNNWDYDKDTSVLHS